MPELTVLSLGGGVQSTALALMAETGRFDSKPDVAFFADTRWEPPRVYQTVAAVRERVSFPVETVDNGRSLADDVEAGVQAQGRRFTPIPLFNSDGGQGQRQCTRQYKIAPIQTAIRARLGIETARGLAAGTVEQWMGISTDEALRASDNRLRWIRNRFPLLEAGISRRDCAEWMAEHHPDVPLGKSACVGCPYHDREAWRQIALTLPNEFARAVRIDHALRTEGHTEREFSDTLAYLHPARIPLDEAVAMSAGTDSLFPDTEMVCDSGHCFV